jgi:3-phenylpropionate/trans-cinnamate dioxygenase ferredoxin reductase subunit
MDNIVVIGAGQAGASLVAKLRALGHEGSVTLVGEEPVLPYERPPLSKGYLLGDLDQERLYLRQQSFYDEHRIETLLGCPVERIDRANRTVHLDGRSLPYDALALTTGSTPVRLPADVGGELPGVFVVRTLADVDALAQECRAGARALVVGGGYIGLEAAAVFSARDMQVTVVEIAERILRRVACAATSDYFRSLHTARGVDVREGAALEELIGDERVRSARLSDDSVIDVDLVVVGIGVRPSSSLAHRAGLDVDDGIAVDDRGRTSDPAVWAAGDCASFPFHGRRIRLESVQNAVDQANVVAANMLGADVPYDPVPWFWSDQYDVKLQIAGLNSEFDSVAVRPGTRDGAVSHWYYRDGRLLSVDAMNDPRSYMLGKRLLEAGVVVDPAVAADPTADLKALLPA